jgi:Fungal specific transcription factor domain/Fungal Zn(2)-Cys(6) binuclear cluster domain
MSSRTRACDSCRLRKTKCVREDGKERCVMCTFHDLGCVYGRRPPQRRRRSNHRDAATAHDAISTSPSFQHPAQGLNQNTPADCIDGPVSPVLSSPHTSPSSQQYGLTGISTPPAAAYPSILDNTLGLDPATHAEYIGSTDYRDPILLDLSPPAGTSLESVRRINERTLFVLHRDESTTSEAQRIADVDCIEAAVQPVGHILVDLYFRFVHPSFPILHKDVFIAKHQESYRLFAPSLLAAVYLLALDWQLHDSLLASGETRNKPDSAMLERLAEVALEQDMRRPKLSTLEAGLLLLQRSANGEAEFNERPTSVYHRFHAQMVATAHELGLQVDCSAWSIPAWEIGLRRRLAWALYIQDLWASFIYGRPPLLHEDNWDVQPCSSTDFPEFAKAEDLAAGGLAASTGWRMFLHHIEISQILKDVMRNYYTAAATRRGGSLDSMGVIAAVDLAKPILARLRQWHASLPQDLSFNSSRPRSLCPSASLHLAYHAVIVALYRALVRILTPETPPSLHTAVRTAARVKVQTAVELLSTMRPEHTAAFWGRAAAHQVAMIGGLAGLLWATSETADEMTWCAARIEDLKWALKVRGMAAPFARQALRLLEREVGGLAVVKTR